MVLLGSSTHQLVAGRTFPLHLQLVHFYFIFIQSFVAVQPELLRTLSIKEQIYIYIISVWVCVCVCVCVCVTSEETAYLY